MVQIEVSRTFVSILLVSFSCLDSRTAGQLTKWLHWRFPHTIQCLCFHRKSSVELAEEKEQKKKEKQREKEREKEREREKKEQKEREKKENEMKKKFKVI